MTSPRVAVIGRPNVGKSTLVNRLAGRRHVIVGPTPGLTRDRIDLDVTWRGRTFTLQDSGGLMQEEMLHPTESIGSRVAEAALRAAASSDLILFVVDAQTGATSEDLAIAKRLRELNKPVIVVANKADDPRYEAEASSLWELGMGEPIPVSAIQGRASGDLLDRIIEALPDAGSEEGLDDLPAVAILGRPNVGKSSLFNRIVGEPRAIVHDAPGTTRDTIDSIVELGEHRFRFIDTAGLRRHAKTQGIEIFSSTRTREAIHRAAAALLVIDAGEGVTTQDQRIARMVEDAGVGAVVIVNKWDKVQGLPESEQLMEDIGDRLGFLDYAPLLRTSATTGRGVAKLAEMLHRVLEARTIRIPTSQLNRILSDAQQAAPPPRRGSQSGRILYATQAEVAPPTFVVFTTGPIASSWTRYLERRLREEFGFEGSPVRIVIRERSQTR